MIKAPKVGLVALSLLLVGAAFAATDGVLVQGINSSQTKYISCPAGTQCVLSIRNNSGTVDGSNGAIVSLGSWSASVTGPTTQSKTVNTPQAGSVQALAFISGTTAFAASSRSSAQLSW